MAKIKPSKSEKRGGRGHKKTKSSSLEAPTSGHVWKASSKKLKALSGMKNAKRPSKKSKIGIRKWKTTSKLSNGGSLREMSKYDEKAGEFFQAVTIRHDSAFTLKPIVFTSGPLKDRHVLVLDAPKAFRFMDLPAEIRCMVYECLLVEEDPIRIRPFKIPGRERRPVREGFHLKRKHEEFTWDNKQGKWKDQPPSNATILQASKQIFSEAAPILYGNEFELRDITDLGLFLGALGDMRRFVKYISLSSPYWWTIGGRLTGPRSLEEMKTLRTVKIRHETLCGDPWGSGCLDPFVKAVRAPLKKLHKGRESQENQTKVLDLFQVSWARCIQCASKLTIYGDEHKWSSHCVGRGGCCTRCKRCEKHCAEVQVRLRSALARALKIEEGARGH